MPESSMWALIVSLTVLALGLACKIAELKHRLNRSVNEALRLQSELDTLNDTHNKEISNIKELNQREIEKIIKEPNKFTHADHSPTINRLDGQDIRVLHLIAVIENSLINSYHDDISVDEDYVSKELQLSPQKTKYHLEKLVNAHYIYYDGYNDLKGLTNKGRTFLKENNMLP